MAIVNFRIFLTEVDHDTAPMNDATIIHYQLSNCILSNYVTYCSLSMKNLSGTLLKSSKTPNSLNGMKRGKPDGNSFFVFDLCPLQQETGVLNAIQIG